MTACVFARACSGPVHSYGDPLRALRIPESLAARERLHQVECPGMSGATQLTGRAIWSAASAFVEAYIASFCRGAGSARSAAAPVAAYRMLVEPDVRAMLDRHCNRRRQA